jgi:hypothetical protein
MDRLPETGDRDNPSPSDELRRVLREAVDVEVGRDASFAVREQAALALTNEAVRENLEEELQAIADEHADELFVDDALYRRHQCGTVVYHSLCGPLEVERWTYRRVGERNGPTVVPLELEAGLMERATPAMAHRVCRGHGRGGSRDLEADLRSSHRCPPSRTTLERMANRLGQAVRKATRRLEPAVRRHERMPSSARVLSVGLDRTTVPMEEPAPPGRQGPLRKRKKPYVRTPPPPIEVNYRMAYVGTVALTDLDGDTVWSRRYAASADEGPAQVLHRMMQDVRWARRERAKLPVLIVQDAAPEMWKLLREALNGEPSVATWHEAIDRYHFAERLATIVETLAVSDRPKLLAEWQKALDEHDDAVDDIRARVDAELDRGYVGKARRTLYEQQTYLENNCDRLRYATLTRRGFPIGSGITEAACKSVIMQRTKRSGQRWHPHGVDAVLALRSHLLNDRLDPIVSQLRRRNYTAKVRRAA